MKRILFVTESLFPLGPARQLIPLAQQLAEHGCEIHVVEFKPTIDETEPPAAPQVVYHSLGTDSCSHPLSRASVNSIHRLRKLVRDLKPDIVHAWCGNSGFITLAATDASFSKTKCRLLCTELFLQPEKSFTRQLYEKKLSHGFETIVVPHESVRNQLIGDGYDSDDIEIIPNTVCDLNFDRAAGRELVLAKLKLPSDAKIAGTAAPLISRTRIKDLIYACDLLTVIRDDFHFLVFGHGHQRSRLQQFAKLTESCEHIHLVGEPRDANAMFAGLDVYWHSHLMEPLPANLLAAMATGVPAISVYGPGTSEIIKHQETGFAVNFGARDEFARWTKYLIELPEQAAKLSSQGQTFVKHRFADRETVNRYLKLYR